jgi:hypothetical protein
MTYDPSDGYILLFGGYDGGYLGDTWEFKGGVWAQLSPSVPTPLPREGASMVYDEAGGYVLLFGGYDGAYLGDIWAFKGGAWTELTPTGLPPSAREDSSMTYDWAGGFVLLFGGYDGAFLGDTFRFKGDGWTQLSPPTPVPSPREGASMAFESAGGFVLLFGGFGGTYLSDTWGFKGGNWTELTISSPVPSPRDNASMSYDSSGGSVLLFGGYDGAYSGETWQFSGGKWTEVPSGPSGPLIRDWASMAYDASDGYVLLFGGFGGTFFGDTWAFKNVSLEGWAQGPGESSGFGAAMAYDMSDGYTVLFGGQTNVYLGSTYVYKGGSWTLLETPAHGPNLGVDECYLYSGGTNTSTQTPCPSPRFGSSMTYDAADGYMLLYGGNNGSNLGDTWMFKGGLWKQLVIASPPGRYFASMTYDEADGYVLLFGGRNNSDLSESWEYKGGIWTQLVLAKYPPGRLSAGMVFDEAAGYVVLFGGNGCTTSGCGTISDLGDTWTYKAGTWTQLYPTSFPSVREYLDIVYDVADGYVLLFGGYGCLNYPTCNSFGSLGDTWKFQNGTWMQMEASANGPNSGVTSCYLYDDGYNQSAVATCPSARDGSAITYDMGQGDILLYGGSASGYLSDGWGAQFPPSLSPLNASPSPVDLGQSVTFSVKVFGGTYLYDYVYSGLPSGCVSANTTSISCIPTSVGESNVTATVRDASGYPLSSSVAFIVYPSPRISSVTSSRPSADIGQRVNFTAIPAPGINPNDTFAWNVSSTGLGCGQSSKSVLTCVPRSPGTTYQVRVNLTDSSGRISPNVTSAIFTVYADPAVSGPTASVRSADVGQNVTFNATLRVEGSGSDSYRWNELPSGCVSSNSLVIGPCMVTAAGRSNVSITVNDSNGVNVTSASLSFLAYGGPIITSPAANRSSADLGQSVGLTATASLGLGPFTYSWTSPAAMGCSSSNESTLTCVPTAPGNYAVSVSATDSNGARSANRSLSYTVFADPSVSVPVPSRLTADAGQNVTFASTLESTGSGSASLVWRASSSSVTCVSLNETATLCSTRAAGNYSVTVEVTDSNGGVGTATSPVVSIASDPVVGAPVLSQSTITLGQGISVSVTVAGGTPGYTFAWLGLPPGCQGSTSDISCTPSDSGSFTIQVAVTDSAGYRVYSSSAVLSVVPPTSGSTQTTSSAGWEIILVLILPPVATAFAAIFSRRRETQDR